ncbi:tRNA (adenosine(37)-N6)-threonylcarbamoyltransferase complex ATPase subunit type 1 TsaE [Candidatus Kaiserbacteria bacterium]|nr:tRNA (adenosine(37)-N6)-threonylcarbamoyltransferase complex ATPase subunit type 1 TsaE [Candidatus Kaiserbacteria bacterium]
MSEITEENLTQEVKHFLDTLVPHTTATVIGLYGDLGAGKTTFTKTLAKTLGVSETVTSPTFVIEKIYTLTGQKFSHLIHIDAYRLEGSHELKQLGWDTIVSDPQNLIIIEWADKVEDILPKHTRKISLTVADDPLSHATRIISYES